MEQLLYKIIKPLVENKDALIIKEISSQNQGRDRRGKRHRTFELTVASDDMGKVIGSKGNIINAIRTIARSMSSVSEKISISVKEPEDHDFDTSFNANNSDPSENAKENKFEFDINS